MRPLPGLHVVLAKCGDALRLARARLVVVCDELSIEAGSMDKRVIVSVDLFDTADAASSRRVRLDAFEGFWDSIVVWARESGEGVDLAIDYVVLD